MWRRPSRARADSRTWPLVAVVAVGAALVAAVVAVDQGVAEFGWVSSGGQPTFTHTVVAAFPVVAFALWAGALVLMVVLLRRRGGPVDPGPAPS
jgi:hypothetical protein